MPSPELQAQIEVWRQMSREKKMTASEYRKVIDALREGRTMAAATSATSRAKKASTKAPAKSSDDLLADLESSLGL